MNRRSVLLLSRNLLASVAVLPALPAMLQAEPVRPRPPLAVGLTGIADWEASQPFIDVFRQSREWLGRSKTEFVSHSVMQLREGGHLDENGWPISLPADATSIGTIILCNIAADDTSMNGRYRMTWDGNGEVNLSGTCSDVTQGAGWAEFDYVASDGGIVLVDITAQDAADPARNFRCINQALQPAYDRGEIFRPAWLEVVRHFRLVRFMDWMATNNSTLSDWSDRPRLSSCSWTPGVPLEVMVTLANTLHVDPWFCFPHLATDDYITSFATYVQENLHPDLVAHYEYSNEVWNFQFEQSQWALEQARQRWPDQGDGWMQVYGGRAAEMAMLLDAVYQAEPARCRKIITAHTGWIDLNHSALDAPLWVAEGRDRLPPKAYFDAYAVTGYFDGGLGQVANLPLIQSWRALGDAPAFIRMAEQILDGRHVSGEESGGTLAGLEKVWKAQKEIADVAGLALVMYEGGSHIVPDAAAMEADPALFDFFVRFNYSSEMGDLYTRAMEKFEAVGGEFFNVFVEIAVPRYSGFWGARRHVLDDNPRWRAIVAHQGADRNAGRAP